MNKELINKQHLYSLFIDEFKLALSACIEAANNAHMAAVDDQSVAETQYDTLAIEAAYLAEGQSKRLIEIKNTLAQFEQLAQQDSSNNINTIVNAVSLGSVVEVVMQNDCQYYYFIGPCAGGKKVLIKNIEITLITPQSPLGLALMNKAIDDDFSFTITNKTHHGYISDIM